mmetsp:Transcript_56752/g.184658  ORF Transcript_56752/g.184658 Transcript_56752/m.184658 type:complete len:300 (-) Transcript_56752:266-1165(-)
MKHVDPKAPHLLRVQGREVHALQRRGAHGQGGNGLLPAALAGDGLPQQLPGERQCVANRLQAELVAVDHIPVLGPPPDRWLRQGATAPPRATAITCRRRRRWSARAAVAEQSAQPAFGGRLRSGHEHKLLRACRRQQHRRRARDLNGLAGGRHEADGDEAAAGVALLPHHRPVFKPPQSLHDAPLGFHHPHRLQALPLASPTDDAGEAHGRQEKLVEQAWGSLAGGQDPRRHAARALEVVEGVAAVEGRQIIGTELRAELPKLGLGPPAEAPVVDDAPPEGASDAAEVPRHSDGHGRAN